MMNDKRFDLLLAANPRRSSLRVSQQHVIRGLSPERIEPHCLERIEDCLATLCVLMFRIDRADKRPIESIFRNDLMTVVLLCCEDLDARWTGSRHVPDACYAGLDTLSDLLIKIGAKMYEPRSTIEDELMAAYYLSLALRNEHRGMSPLQDFKHEVPATDHYRRLLTKATLLEVITETRARFLS